VISWLERAHFIAEGSPTELIPQGLFDVVDLDSSEVKLFEAVLAWKRSHPRPPATTGGLVDPMFDYGTITTLRQSQERLDKAQRQQVADQYLAGIAIKVIVTTFGIHRQTTSKGDDHRVTTAVALIAKLSESRQLGLYHRDTRNPTSDVYALLGA